MSTLLVQELLTELSQDITLASGERYSVGGMYPYIYLHNSPSGTFTLEIIRGVTTVASKSFTSTDIKNSVPTANNYLHCFYPVIFDNNIQLEKGDYTVKISASGYTYSASSFIGWIQQHENLNNNLDYTPVGDEENPLALRFKVYRRY